MRAGSSTEEAILEPQVAPRPGEGRAPNAEESAGWERVRDSWVEVPPVAKSSPAEPPPLPASLREPPTGRSPADEALADRMLERLAAGDHVASLMAAEALLRRRPRDGDALDCAEMSRTKLREVYAARLGGTLHRVAIIANREAIASLTLDLVTTFLLSRIDGLTMLHDIAFTREVSPEHALRVLSELYLKGVVSLV
jgi:hypothetical protein